MLGNKQGCNVSHFSESTRQNWSTGKHEVLDKEA